MPSATGLSRIVDGGCRRARSASASICSRISSSLAFTIVRRCVPAPRPPLLRGRAPMPEGAAPFSCEDAALGARGRAVEVVVVLL